MSNNNVLYVVSQLYGLERMYEWKPWGLECFLGRRTSKNDEQYSYNIRDELISADEVSYNYDDIGIYAPTSVSEVGNRIIAEGKTYTANNLNQYTAIDDFVPQYDDDGIHAPTSMCPSTAWAAVSKCAR